MRYFAALALLCALVHPSYAAEMPDWFAETLLDASDEASDATKAGKRVMLYFWLTGCPYCERMTRETFTEPALAARLKRDFVPIGINVRGDRDIIWTDGTTRTEKTLTAALKVRGTPTMLFLDGRGAVALRLTGYLPPADFMRALDALSTAPRAALHGASP